MLGFLTIDIFLDLMI